MPARVARARPHHPRPNRTGGAPAPRRRRTGFAYYGYRYLDPVSGRWASWDPIEEKGWANLYSFGPNSPTSGWDVLGRQWSGPVDPSSGGKVPAANQPGQPPPDPNLPKVYPVKGGAALDEAASLPTNTPSGIVGAAQALADIAVRSGPLEARKQGLEECRRQMQSSSARLGCCRWSFWRYVAQPTNPYSVTTFFGGAIFYPNKLCKDVAEEERKNPGYRPAPTGGFFHPEDLCPMLFGKSYDKMEAGEKEEAKSKLKHMMSDDPKDPRLSRGEDEECILSPTK